MRHEVHFAVINQWKNNHRLLSHWSTQSVIVQLKCSWTRRFFFCFCGRAGLISPSHDKFWGLELLQIWWYTSSISLCNKVSACHVEKIFHFKCCFRCFFIDNLENASNFRVRGHVSKIISINGSVKESQAACCFTLFECRPFFVID